MAVKRTFGWVQTPGDLKNLKKMVSVFNSNSKENRWMVKKKITFTFALQSYITSGLYIIH